MASFEERVTELQAARDPKWVDKRLSKLARWPGKRRATLREILTDQKRSYDGSELRARIEKAKLFFQGLSAAQRTSFWQTLFPKMAATLERAWLESGKRPYQYGPTRLPFRAPQRSDVVEECRARFVVTACDLLRGLNEDVVWLAVNAVHLPVYYRDPHAAGWILATALRSGGGEADAVRAVLVDSINGEHEIGEMGQHCIVALLNSEARADWEVVSKLLLAAQRQEGLRQAILEAVDEAHPGAFRYMLGVILEHDLARFSATVRAFDVWLSVNWSAGSTKVVNDGVRQICAYFDDPECRAAAIATGSPKDAYIALWVAAYEDAQRAVELAAPLLEDESPDRRFVAVRSLDRIALFPESLELIGARVVSGAETDPRVQMAMMSSLAKLRFESVSEELFKATVDLFERMPAHRKKLDSISWPWTEYALDRRVVAEALKALALSAPDKLIPFAQALDGSDCVRVVEELAGLGTYWQHYEYVTRKRRKLTPQARRLMLDLIADTRRDVQQIAFQALAGTPVEEDEVAVLLGQLHRTAAKLRAGAIGRLSQLTNSRALEVATQLIADNDAKKRAAGFELAAHLIETKRAAEPALQLVRAHADSLRAAGLKESVDRLVGDAGRRGLARSAF